MQFVAYARVKAAPSTMTPNMVLDLRLKVRINAIEPAEVTTVMLKAGFNGEEDKYQQMGIFHLIGRIRTTLAVEK
jgi:NAD(P)-dependent dehydrogenase (short-subunit alcohol dehydrogenase family)